MALVKAVLKALEDWQKRTRVATEERTRLLRESVSDDVVSTNPG